MTTIAEKIAQSFGNNYGLFSSPESGNLVDVCAHQAIKNVEEFGKRKFVFTDDSAIGMGDGQWFVGYADCFCNAGVGHHPQCPGSQKPPPQPTAPPPAAPKQEASVSPFTIHILGKENRKVAVDGSQHKARVDARALLTKDKRATYAFIFDHKGEITDAYERTVSAGEVKIKKVDPKKLLDTVRATLKG